MGGASSVQNVEQLLATTYMIGQAIAAITFPGMYRIYDFHSKKAPRLKTSASFSFFDNESEDEEDDNYLPPDPSQYEHLFHVTVGTDVIYFDDPLMVNESGWTPLHACCMSFSTVPAGIALIAETVRRGGSLDIKTLAGPGSFNKGWTPLLMACAYGVEPLVEALAKEGADVNTVNSYGYTPLLESCHRGFTNIVMILLKYRANVNYLPPEELASSSPFIGAPPQSPIGEAARSGFFKIVQELINYGANKDIRNYLGWTALHEACFYNRIETAKMLLLSGASATIRTSLGALPYHLAGLQYLRTMLSEMGGSEAVPKDGDEIDMISVLKELTMADIVMEDDEDNSGGYELLRDSNDMSSSISGVRHLAIRDSSEEKSYSGLAKEVEDEEESTGNESSSRRSPGSNKTNNKARKNVSYSRNGNDEDDEGETKDGEEKLLHSGAVLGDLPSLSTHRTTPSKARREEFEEVLREGSPTIRRSPDKNSLWNNPNSISAHHHNSNNNNNNNNYTNTSSNTASPSVSLKADSKVDKKKKKKKKGFDANIPVKYSCQLTQRLMTEPVKSIYGNIFDKSAILSWFSQQGRICPLTGAPLCENDLKPLDDLALEIKKWLEVKGDSEGYVPPLDTPNIDESKGDHSAKEEEFHHNNNNNTNNSNHNNNNSGSGSSRNNNNDDDLYDF